MNLEDENKSIMLSDSNVGYTTENFNPENNIPKNIFIETNEPLNQNQQQPTFQKKSIMNENTTNEKSYDLQYLYSFLLKDYETDGYNDAISNPKFDKMSDVTKHCIALLDSAANLTSGTAYSAAFAGSFDWAEVANTLKARAYLRMGDYAGALAAAKNGVSAGADMYANHSTESPGAWNLYYDFLDWNRGGYISCDGAPIVGMLDTASTSSKNNAKTDETARFDYYFLADNYTPLDPNMYTGIFAPTSNFAMVSYVENELIMAECYVRGGDNANALFHLNNVRKEHEANYGGYKAYVLSDLVQPQW